MTTALPRERATSSFAQLIAALEANVARLIRGKPEAIRHTVIALIGRGHL